MKRRHLSHRKVQIPHHNKDILCEEEQPSYYFDVEVELLLEGHHGEYHEDVEEFEEDHEVGKSRGEVDYRDETVF